MLYCIMGTITRPGTWEPSPGNRATITSQFPTFYLDSQVQGFMDAEGAKGVARSILLAGCPDSDVVANVSAVPVN